MSKNLIAKYPIFVIVGGAVILSIVGAIWYVGSSHAPSFTATTATRGNVIEALDEPGTIAAEDNVNLSFQEPGQIAQVNIAEGQSVAAGTMLASLDSATLQAGIEQASATLAAAQAKLDELQVGTRPEQLNIDESAVTNAQSALAVDVGNAYTSADDAVHNQTDNLFENPRSGNPIFLISTADSQLSNNIQISRLTIEGVLTNWHSVLIASSSNPLTLSGTADSALAQVKAYLDSLALAVNDAMPNANVTASMIVSYKIDVETARTEVATAITTMENAEAALTTAQGNLALAQAGSTAQDIEAQQAVVAQAQAATDAAKVALANASLVAPFPGTVENLTAQIGQVVAPGAPVLTLVNNSGLKIETYVSEADVTKIKMGDQAQVTLDAFGTGTSFPATVTTVDSAETQVNGTPAYLITLHFTSAQSQVKDGMTGNVHIVLGEDDNVIEIPSRLVINNGANYYVLVATPTGTVQQPVQIGLVGQDGMTEITSGITVGTNLANY
jgi:multidrug efflux pump subunit AcrA (membrane-fusion protein)